MEHDKEKILRDTESYIKDYFEDESSGHDWWHIYRVKNMALKIAEKEGGDKFIIEMTALLHDLDDWKLNGCSENSKTKLWLEKTGLVRQIQDNILEIIQQVSFKGAEVKNRAISIEAKVVQDADRLDAIGAIGIARTFAYGGSKGRLIYDPETEPVLHKSFEDYKNSTAPTINHFYEKLLLLKDRLNTATAKHLAEKRHNFMKQFLKQFYDEWEGEL